MDATDATNAATSASACGPPACTSLHRINTTCMLAPLDKHILAVIQSNARLSHTELASHVDSTPTSCRNRLQHLERAGYILDYTALLDPVKLGMPLLMFIEITLDRAHPEAFGRLPKVLSEVPEVLECHRVTGKFDFLVKMRAKDVSGLHRISFQHAACLSRHSTNIYSHGGRRDRVHAWCTPGLRHRAGLAPAQVFLITELHQSGPFLLCSKPTSSCPNFSPCASLHLIFSFRSQSWIQH